MLRLLLIATLSFTFPQAATGVYGTWRGKSDCVGDRPSCRDEITRYVFRRSGDATAPITVDADKFVNGVAENMGALACQAGAKGDVSCRIPPGVWQFKATGDTLTGSLILNDGSQARRVLAHREKP